MPRLNAVDWITYVLATIGAINWGLVGLFGFNLVEFVFGSIPLLVAIIYVLIGLAGLWMIYMGFKLSRRPTPMAR